MQWLVTTGPTVDDAKARALSALGIDEVDLEFEVLAEAKTSLFGLRTTPARVRARVRPTRPRPKADRRNRRPKREKRRRGRRDETEQSGSEPASTGSASSSKPPKQSKSRKGQAAGGGEGAGGEPHRPVGETAEDATSQAPTPAPERLPKLDPPKTSDDHDRAARTSGSRGAVPMSDIPLTEQEPTAVDFVTGLVEAFGADADVYSEQLDDDEAIEINVEGDDLGLLVGQRGTTLSAIAELTRTAVAQQHSGRLEGRLRVDIAGYRARRKEALVRFAGQIADKVVDTGSAVAMEPMSPPDRKIVHDAINDIDGVYTSSRGEDRRRHVVIHPDED